MLSMRRKQIGNLSNDQFVALLLGHLTPVEYREHLIANAIIQT